MSAPTQLNVTVIQNTNGTVATSTVAIPIPVALTSLDSTTPGASQTGYSAADQLVRSIFRAGVFSDAAGNWYPTGVIQKITAQ